jgi:hypothetical protein
MGHKKVVISPDNKKAIAFFEKLSEKKKEQRERAEKRMSKVVDILRKRAQDNEQSSISF